MATGESRGDGGDVSVAAAIFRLVSGSLGGGGGSGAVTTDLTVPQSGQAGRFTGS
jgi:hypothetical protein